MRTLYSLSVCDVCLFVEHDSILDRDGLRLQEPFWQAQQKEADVRFEAMDVLGAEHEAEAEAHKKLDQELESISTGRREDMQQAFGGYAYSMMIYHGRSLVSPQATMRLQLFRKIDPYLALF